MAVLLLGYVNDPVVLETFGAIIGCRFGSADYESVFEEVPTEFSNFGTIRSGRLTYLHSGRKIKRVVLAFLNPSVTAARVIDRLGFAPANAVLAAKAHPSQIERMQRSGADLSSGYAVFCNERAPYTDVGNAFLVTGERRDKGWSEELAKAIVHNFVFPELATAPERKLDEPIVPAERTMPQAG
jgi:hypothetical protein